MGLVIKKVILGEEHNFSTNKVAKSITPKIDVKKIAIEYPELGITILKPSIDRITFGFDPDEKLFASYGCPASDASEYREYIQKSLTGDAYATACPHLTHVTDVSFFKPPYKDYNQNFWFKPSPSCEPVLVQVGPKKAKYPLFRFNLYPNRMSAGDFAVLWSWIDSLLLMPATGQVISREDFLIWSKIYSMEIAVEMLGVRPDDLEMQSVAYKKVQPTKAHLYVSAKGRTETYYFNAKLGKKSTEYVYDKRAEMMETGNQPLYGDLFHSRFECRIGRATFHKLLKLTNRFGRASIAALDKKAFALLSLEKQQFLKLSLKSTQGKALSLVPESHKADFQEVHADCIRNIWDAKKLWLYYPEAILKSGLLGQVKI